MTPATHARSAGAAGGAGLVPSETLQVGERFLSSHPADQVVRRLQRLRRNVLAAAKLHTMHDEAGHRPARAWFVTLTYRGRDDWRASHVRDAIERYRLWCRKHRIACRYEWVAELQSRGAMHYHLIAWLPAGFSMPKWDTQRDAHGRVWWPHGMSNRQRVKSGAGYLAKYLSKMGEFHRFPKGARLYGVGGLSCDGRAIRSWWNLPEWCRRVHGVGDVVRRAGRLVVRHGAQVLASPYRVRRVPGGFVVRLVGELAERFHEGAFSTFPRPVAAQGAAS